MNLELNLNLRLKEFSKSLFVATVFLLIAACSKNGGAGDQAAVPDPTSADAQAYEKAYASILSDASLQPGNVIFGPETFSSVDFLSTRYDRTILVGAGHAGKYKLKILNGNYGPLLAKQCALLTVVEEKRQCLYDNLVDGVQKELTRVDKSFFTLNGKKLLGGVVFDKTRSYIELPIDLNYLKSNG